MFTCVQSYLKAIAPRIGSFIAWSIFWILWIPGVMGLPHAATAQVKIVSDTEESRLLSRHFFEYTRMPDYFTFPYEAEAPLAIADANLRSPVYVWNQSRSQLSNGLDLGLRLIVVSGSQNRILASEQLAETGLFQPGDLVLSFRPEWYGSLRYSHIQLGISHSGILYIEESRGRKFLKNIDMPMDAKHMGQGYLNAEHYLTAPFVHIVRPRGLTEEQKRNLKGWLSRLAVRGPKAYQRYQIRFNQDYGDPKIVNDPELGFVADVGRIALGLPNKAYKTVTNYCSEFVWSILALKNCDPEARETVQAFAQANTPHCIKPHFPAMPVLGNFVTETDKKRSDLTIGLADGPLLIFEYLKGSLEASAAPSYLDIDKHMSFSVFDSASNDPTRISSGHQAVEKKIIDANPNFYDYLKQYYALANDENAERNPMLQGLRAQFNASQAANYSPTSFKILATLPDDSPLKTFDYIGTVFYSTTLQIQSQNVDLYRKLEELTSQ